MLKKAKSMLRGQASSRQEKPAQEMTKPRFESILKDRPRRFVELERQRPGLSQTQEALARQWRQSNNLYLVKG